MPARRLGGLEPHAIHAARVGARAGDSAQMIAADLEWQFPELPTSRLRQIAVREYDSNQRLDILAGLNWGQFQNIPSLLGCPRGGSVTVSLKVTTTDPLTGMPFTFDHTATVGNPRSVNQLLREAIGKVLEAAREKGYAPGDFGPINRESIANNVEVGYVECS